MQKASLLLLFTCLTGLQINKAEAITIDAFNFSTSQRIEANPIALVVQQNGDPLGGSRSVEITRTTALGAGGTVSSNFSSSKVISLDQGAGAKGKMELVYDGDLVAGLSNFRGLGGVDLTQGNANALTFDVWYDNPFGSTGYNIVFTAYESAEKWSRGILTLNQRYDTFTPFTISFSSMNIFGSSGPANLSNIGAISLLFDGTNAAAADFMIRNLSTNSNTTAVPEPTSLLLALSGLGFYRRKKFYLRD